MNNEIPVTCEVTHCPFCDADMDGGDIYETLLKQTWWQDKYTPETLLDYVRESYSYPRRWSRLIGIEPVNGYDGITMWQCPDCDKVWKRFAWVKDSEVEEQEGIGLD